MAVQRLKGGSGSGGAAVVKVAASEGEERCGGEEGGEAPIGGAMAELSGFFFLSLVW